MQQITHLIMASETELKASLGNIKTESLSDRDAGFCSGEETDLDTETHSPTDSRDSLDTKYTDDSFKVSRNKRKCAEPRKMADDNKRRLLDIKEERIVVKSEPLEAFCPYSYQQSPLRSNDQSLEYNEVNSGRRSTLSLSEDVKGGSPFRPWNTEQKCIFTNIPSGYVPQSYSTNNVQEEPLALVVDKKRNEMYPSSNDLRNSSVAASSYAEFQSRMHPVLPQDEIRLRNMEKQRLNMDEECETNVNMAVLNSSRFTSLPLSSTSSDEKRKSSSHLMGSQRNYKNMTRERRIEANARERTRVHTISAAFDTLRKSVPAYANNQKLSKLSVLRIACAYIMTLSRIAGYDYSADHSEPSVADCVDSVCSTIQSEGKARKKKDD